VTTDQKPFLDHAQELKARVLWCLLAVAVGSCVGYFY
jgi:Sec-independent protein secretion pathway component TatC